MRKARLLKWFSLFGAACLGLTWILSLFFRMTYHWQDHGNGDHSVTLDEGTFQSFSVYGMCRGFGSSGEPASGWFYVEHHWPPTSLGLDLPSCFEDPHGASRKNGFGVFMLNVPLWVPFIVLIALAGGSSYFTRRKPYWNQCATCWYDLTGNESGICPECGTRIARQGTSKNSPSMISK